MCNIGAVILYMPPIGYVDWIGFRKLDPRPTLIFTHFASLLALLGRHVSAGQHTLYEVLMIRLVDGQ